MGKNLTLRVLERRLELLASKLGVDACSVHEHCITKAQAAAECRDLAAIVRRVIRARWTTSAPGGGARP